jgi:hypothetical protein
MTERRAVRQPFLLDSAPLSVRRAVVSGRADGASWKKISEVASRSLGRRISPNSAQRWFELRIGGLQTEVLAQLSRAIADAVVTRGFDKLPRPIRSLLGDQVFQLLHAESPSAAEREGVKR